MKYYKASINILDGQKHYGDMPTYFALGYEDKITNLAYFILPEGLNRNFLDLQEITQAEYESSINSIIDNERNERIEQEELLVKQFKDQLSFNKELKDRLMTADEKYKALDLTIADLQTVKDAKIDQLSYLCEQDILNGFTSTLNNHHYRTNRDDQTNFLGKFNQLMNNTSIATVMWKTEDVGYTEHTREDWLTIYYEALTNKETKLFKYDQLKQTVNAQTTVADVDTIVW